MMTFPQTSPAGVWCLSAFWVGYGKLSHEWKRKNRLPGAGRGRALIGFKVSPGSPELERRLACHPCAIMGPLLLFLACCSFWISSGGATVACNYPPQLWCSSKEIAQACKVRKRRKKKRRCSGVQLHMTHLSTVHGGGLELKSPTITFLQFGERKDTCCRG